jgi:hypothetical protein
VRNKDMGFVTMTGYNKASDKYDFQESSSCPLTHIHPELGISTKKNYIPLFFMARKPEVIKELGRLHKEYGLTQDEKACDNIIFVRLTDIIVFYINFAFTLHLVIILLLQLYYQMFDFFKTML